MGISPNSAIASTPPKRWRSSPRNPTAEAIPHELSGAPGSVAPEQPANDRDDNKLEHDPYTLRDGVRRREAFQVEKVEDRMRHGVHRSRADRDCAQQPPAGHRGCSEHHRQGKAE